MTKCETLTPRWNGPILVVATGESVTKKLAALCVESGRPIVAIKQACQRIPSANVVYACDSHHWELMQGYPHFRGEKWSTHDTGGNSKAHIAKQYGLRLVEGRHKSNTFSTDPSIINYGNSSGFQAIGFAIHWLHKPGRIILVGFDMQGEYFFGSHPRGQQLANFGPYTPFFESAAKKLPEGVEIVMGTPSAMTCFPSMRLEDALANDKAWAA